MGAEAASKWPIGAAAASAPVVRTSEENVALVLGKRVGRGGGAAAAKIGKEKVTGRPAAVEKADRGWAPAKPARGGSVALGAALKTIKTIKNKNKETNKNASGGGEGKGDMEVDRPSRRSTTATTTTQATQSASPLLLERQGDLHGGSDPVPVARILRPVQPGC